MRRHDVSYANRRWMALAQAFVSRYPFCVLCLVHGQVNMGATEYHSEIQRNLIVDHIEPHRGDSALFWDQDNLETLCRFPCHDKDKQRHESQGKDGAAWLDYLRQVMLERQTEHLVSQHMQWMPDKVAAAICPVGGGAMLAG